MRSGHSFPPLIAGLTTNLHLNEEPVASGADHSFQSVTIHGSWTESYANKYSNMHALISEYLYKVQDRLLDVQCVKFCLKLNSLLIPIFISNKKSIMAQYW